MASLFLKIPDYRGHDRATPSHPSRALTRGDPAVQTSGLPEQGGGPPGTQGPQHSEPRDSTGQALGAHGRVLSPHTRPLQALEAAGRKYICKIYTYFL